MVNVHIHAETYNLIPGFLVEFISMPVTCGFTSAAAVTILFSQLKNLLGLSGSPDWFVEWIINFFTNIQNFRVGDSILGIVTLVTLIAIKVGV